MLNVTNLAYHTYTLNFKNCKMYISNIPKFTVVPNGQNGHIPTPPPSAPTTAWSKNVVIVKYLNLTWL